MWQPAAEHMNDAWKYVGACLHDCFHALPVHVGRLSDSEVCGSVRAEACSSGGSNWKLTLRGDRESLIDFCAAPKLWVERGGGGGGESSTVQTSWEALGREERQTDRRGHKGSEKRGSGRKGMKGNARERGNGRLDGNWASVKESERERTREGGSDLSGSDGVNICSIPPNPVPGSRSKQGVCALRGRREAKEKAGRHLYRLVWRRHRKAQETLLLLLLLLLQAFETETLLFFAGELGKKVKARAPNGSNKRADKWVERSNQELQSSLAKRGHENWVWDREREKGGWSGNPNWLRKPLK